MKNIKISRVMMLYAIFNNISAISCWSVLLVYETGVPGRKPPTCRKSLINFIIKISIKYRGKYCDIPSDKTSNSLTSIMY